MEETGDPNKGQNEAVELLETKSSSSPNLVFKSLEDFMNSLHPQVRDIVTTEPEALIDKISSLTPEEAAAFVEHFPLNELSPLITKLVKAGLVEKQGSLSFRNLFYKKEGQILVNGVSGFLASQYENETSIDVAVQQYINKHNPKASKEEFLDFATTLKTRGLKNVEDLRWLGSDNFDRLLASIRSDHPVSDHVINGIRHIYSRNGMHVAVIGQGCSAFFEVLGKRVNAGYVSGEIMLNGKPPDEAYKRVVGLVSKDDTHLPMLTVRETLMISSVLHADRKLPKIGALMHTEFVLRMLALTHAANTIVGDQNIRGVSGGEKRRVSIGTELVAGHSIVLLDLPTNGLDSNSALSFVKSTSNITKSGNHVMMSLVQPSPELLNQFHYIMLLSRGTCIYFGGPERAEQYFNHLGFQRPAHKSLPDFLGELCKAPNRFYTAQCVPREISVDHEDFVTQLKPTVSEQGVYEHRDTWSYVVQSYKASSMYDRVGKILWKDLEPQYDLSEPEKPRQYQTTIPEQMRMLMWREGVLLLRNKPVTVGGVMRALLIAIVAGTLFLDLGDSQQDAQVRFGMLFFTLAFNTMNALQDIPRLMAKRVVYYDQTASGYFHGTSYYISSIIVSLPSAIIETMVFSIISYGLMGLQDGVFSGRFWYFWLVMITSRLTGAAFIRMMTNLAPNETVAQAVAPVFMVLFMIFNGFLAPKDSIPSGWIWMYYLSFFTYAIKGLALNEYDGLRFTCPLPVCPLNTGQDMLTRFSMQESDPSGVKWQLYGVLVAFFAVFTILGGIFAIILRWSGEETVEILDRSDKEEEAVQPPRTSMTKASERGVSLMFKDLSYDVTLKDGSTRRLLNKINGFVPPGKLVALMGASGAGKSTLLDVLANKKTGGSVDGTLEVDGKPRGPSFGSLAGYVEQTDSHEETATVLEAVRFSAHLRLPQHMPSSEKERIVEKVLDQLELRHVQNDIIGSVETGGITPELRKKVTIAVELVMQPAVLFLDEPTTGLSSTAAIAVVDTVRKLANTNIPCICTVHQPSQEIIDQFDWILLLQPGGTVVYFGALSQMSDYMASVGLGRCPPGKNIADFALDAIALSQEKRKTDPSFDAAKLFEESAYGRAVMQALEHGKIPPPCLPQLDGTRAAAKDTGGKQDDAKDDGSFAIGVVDEDSDAVTSVYASSPQTQFWWLLQRFWNASIRDRATLSVRIIQPIFVSFVVGTLYFHIGNGQQDASNRVALAFLSLMFSFFGAQLFMPLIVSRRSIYFRENTSHTYRPTVYFFARAIADIPFLALQSLSFVTIMYWLVGLSDDDHGIKYAALLLLFYIVNFLAMSFAELCATVAPDAELANVMNVVLLTFMMLFTGFLAPFATIPTFWRFMYYFNFFRYPLFYMATNELAGLQFSCSPGQPCLFTTGAQVLDQYDMATDDLPLYLVISIVLALAVKVLSYTAFMTINHVKR